MELDTIETIKSKKFHSSIYFIVSTLDNINKFDLNLDIPFVTEN